MAIRGERDFDTEFRVVWPDGSIHNIRAMAIVQRDETGKSLHMIGTNWDITEQKRIEEALLKAKQDADIANKAKSEFLANMSHEIRTPMNAILGFSEALYYKLNSEQQKKMVKSVLSSGNLLMSLLNDILDLSKIEAGKLDITFQPVNLSSIIDEIIMLFKDKAQAKDLNLLSNVYPGFPGTVMLDEIRIKQILFNLVGNAIKFTNKGYVKINIRFSPTADSKGAVIIEVEDTGIGVEQSQLDIIFEAFRQQAGQSNRKYGGTGLGLAISKRLAEKMNGHISVISSLCVGSTFTVTFPEVEVSYDNIQKMEYLNNDVPNISFEEATVMIVDDVVLNIETIENLLASSGLISVSAESGEAALEKLKFITPAVILLDMRMSGIDGYEVARILKEDPEKKHIPIIAFTASVVSSRRIESSGYFSGYLYKPVKRADLYKMLSRFLKHSLQRSSENIDKKGFVTIAEIPSGVVKVLPEIVKVLKQKMIPQWDSVKDSFVLFNIESFADELKGVATQYNFGFLEAYANRLKEDIDNIDLDSLKESLQEFPDIVRNIEELS
jgi:signal transduction histidine kinase/FixJ family two-component response regulator